MNIIIMSTLRTCGAVGVIVFCMNYSILLSALKEQTTAVICDFSLLKGPLKILSRGSLRNYGLSESMA